MKRNKIIIISGWLVGWMVVFFFRTAKHTNRITQLTQIEKDFQSIDLCGFRLQPPYIYLITIDNGETKKNYH